MAAISLEHVTKRYDSGLEAVSDANLEIADGEFMILVGPSGSGKSTLLRMIAGLDDISSGELRIGGERVNDKAPKDRDIAMVFQNYALYPHMTVRENIAFPLVLAKTDKATVERKVDEVAKTLELEELLDRKPAQLSGGQRQRVAMGRAIVREPSAFLMDEPLSNLDAQLRVAMRAEIARLQDRMGTTTVYVTHDQIEAMTLGDRVAVLRRGVIQQVASPRELYEEPVNVFVAGFIGSPAMNFLPATVRGSALSLPMAELSLTDEQRKRIGSADRAVLVGIRPEHFEDAALIDDDVRHAGAVFTTRVDLVESLGAELVAHLAVSVSPTRGGQVEEVLGDLRAADIPGSRDELVARLNPASSVKARSDAEIWLDARRLYFFDPETGVRL